MTLIKLAAKSLYNRKAAALLTLISIAFSVMLLLSLERIRHDAKASFASTVSGTDLIVGARSGDIQLLLASVFRIGHTTAGVSWQSYLHIAEQRGVSWAIPLSLGDSHKGFAVLGTSPDYFSHFRYGKKRPLAFAEGTPFSAVNQLVLGSEVAGSLGYQQGDTLVLSHGMGTTSFQHHDENPFVVVGILAPTGTPVDKTLHVPLAAIERLHDKHSHAEEATEDLIGEPSQISAFLVGLDSPLYTLQLRRNINTYKDEALLAIMPTVTLSELWRMLGMLEKVLLLFSGAVLLVSLLGMLTTMLSGLDQRRRELAILRSVGARPRHILALISLESVLLTAAGILLGCSLFYILLAAGQEFLQSRTGLSVGLGAPSAYEWMLMGVILLAGLTAGVIPAVRAYYYSLADGMSVKT